MSHLTAYKAVYTDSSALFLDISEAVNLVACDIHLWSGRFDRLLTFPGLRHLSVTLGRLLDHIVAPDLQELRIYHIIDRILPFLRKSACTLTRLPLVQINQAETDVIRRLQGIPSLTTRH
ncbi:hypothetical protein B0H14DRAFT_3431756 [Mycena olivaceomarginata]|nr:hypothetical protein B0H14DRAFT_3431756 [Mycena olivaceomarginata]